jgi:hypothetical protein
MERLVKPAMFFLIGLHVAFYPKRGQPNLSENRFLSDSTARVVWPEWDRCSNPYFRNKSRFHMMLHLPTSDLPKDRLGYAPKTDLGSKSGSLICSTLAN